jgi:hypothetical protein
MDWYELYHQVLWWVQKGSPTRKCRSYDLMYQPLLVLSPVDFFILIDVTLLNLPVDSPDDVRV